MAHLGLFLIKPEIQGGTDTCTKNRHVSDVRGVGWSDVDSVTGRRWPGDVNLMVKMRVEYLIHWSIRSESLKHDLWGGCNMFDQV